MPELDKENTDSSKAGDKRSTPGALQPWHAPQFSVVSVENAEMNYSPGPGGDGVTSS
jgi:hypothetical protein